MPMLQLDVHQLNCPIKGLTRMNTRLMHITKIIYITIIANALSYPHGFSDDGDHVTGWRQHMACGTYSRAPGTGSSCWIFLENTHRACRKRYQCCLDKSTCLEHLALSVCSWHLHAEVQSPSSSEWSRGDLSSIWRNPDSLM